MPLTPFEARCQRLWDLRDLLYQEDGCACGGPLHVLLDDGNVRDVDLVHGYRDLQDARWEHVRGIGMAILHELTYLTVAQRYTWWRHDDLEDIQRAATAQLVSTPSGYELSWPSG